MTKQPVPGLHENFAEEAAMTDKAMVTDDLQGLIDHLWAVADDGKTPSGAAHLMRCAAEELTALAQAEQPAAVKPLEITYTNWRGETSARTIKPRYVWFGATEWHPEPQWLLTAFDLEKNADRDFALSSFGAPPLAHPPAKRDAWETAPPESHVVGWEEVAEHYRLAMLEVERRISAQPIRELLPGQSINETARFLSDLGDVLREARHKVIFKEPLSPAPVPAAEITRLQKELETAREDALEQAKAAVCSGCRDGHPLNESGYHQQGVAYTFPCHASAIRTLKDKEVADG